MSFAGTQTTTFGRDGVRMEVEPLNTVHHFKVFAKGGTIYADSFKMNEILRLEGLVRIIQHVSNRCARQNITIKDEDIRKMLLATLDAAGVVYEK